MLIMRKSIQEAKEVKKDGITKTMIFIGEDDEAYSHICRLNVKRASSENSYGRLVSVRSRNHGNFEIGVIDHVCLYCGQYIPYDGLSDALFCISRYHVFTRELLDSWLCDF